MANQIVAEKSLVLDNGLGVFFPIPKTELEVRAEETKTIGPVIKITETGVIMSFPSLAIPIASHQFPHLGKTTRIILYSSDPSSYEMTPVAALRTTLEEVFEMQSTFFSKDRHK